MSKCFSCNYYWCDDNAKLMGMTMIILNLKMTSGSFSSHYSGYIPGNRVIEGRFDSCYLDAIDWLTSI